MRYRVIHKKDFLTYGVKEIHPAIRLIIAFCLANSQEEFVTNIIVTSQHERDLIHFVRRCKIMNEEFQKKQKERDSYLYGTTNTGSNNSTP